MVNDNRYDLNKRELETLSTADLELLLRAELENGGSDGRVVREIMGILRQRDAENPKMIPQSVEVALDEENRKPELEKTRSKHNAFRQICKIAAVAATLVIVVLGVPHAFGADSIVELVASWTKGTFQFIRPGETIAQTTEYVFEAEHAGLQEIYDTVSDLGVTVSVVPMWVPDGFTLTEIKVTENIKTTTVQAKLEFENLYIVLQIIIHKYTCPPQSQLVKDENSIEKKEIGDIVHYLMCNSGEYVAAWVTGPVEGIILTNTSKEMLVDIIRSIY